MMSDHGVYTIHHTGECLLYVSIVNEARYRLAPTITTTTSLTLLPIPQNPKTPSSLPLPTVLPLPTLLLRRHDAEIPITLILRRFLGGTLLGDLAPAAGLVDASVVRAGALGRRGSVDQAFVGEFLATDEFFGEVARVDGAGGAVDGLGQHVGVGGEGDEVGDEFFGCGLCQ